MAPLWGVLFGIFLFTGLCLPLLSSSDNSSTFITTFDLRAVLKTIERLVLYYQNNYKYLNLDGLFGLRTIEGQMQLLLSEHKAGLHQHLPAEVVATMTALHWTARNASHLSLEFVRSDDRAYFQDFSYLISSPWLFSKPHRKLDTTLRWEIPQYKAKMKVKLNEDMSDKCMTELMRSGAAGAGCLISQDCAKIMTSRGLTGYGILHQVLWSMVAEIVPGCNVSVNKILSQYNMGNISTFQMELCANIFYEMVAVVQVLMHGKVHESHQDLFLEQQFVCPNLGFYEFLKPDYLKQILSWQFPSGCFGDQQGPPIGQDLNVAALLQGYHNSKTRLIPEFSKLQPEDNLVQNMKISSNDFTISPRKGTSNVALSSSDISETTSQLNDVKKVVQSSKGNSYVSLANTIMLNVSQPLFKEVENKVKHLLQDLNPVKASLDRPHELWPHKSNFDRDKTHLKFLHADPNLSSQKKLLAKPQLLSTLHSFSEGRHFSSNKSQNQQRPDDLNGDRNKAQVDKRNRFLGESIRTHVQRHLLVEKDMEGGCLSHKTGVGSGALIMYLRYLIDPGEINWAHQHDFSLSSDSRNLLQAGREGGAVAGGEEAILGPAEEEVEDDDENMEQEDADLNENAHYDDANDAEGGDDYNEEQALEDQNKVVGDDGQEFQNSNTVIINEDAEKDSVYSDHNLHGLVKSDNDGADQGEEDHNYYDDDGETERGIIRRRRPQTSRPHPPIKIRRKHSEVRASMEPVYGLGPELLGPDHPNYTVILCVSVAPFLILFFFLFKFIRKRRVQIRYYF